MKTPFLLLFPLLGLASPLSAAIIWQDNFDDGARASAPNPYHYAGGLAGNDYTASIASGHTFSTSSGWLAGNDPNGSQSLINIYGDQFSQTSFAAGTAITVSYNFRVTSLVATGASVPRVSIMSGSGVTGSEVLTIGFSYANFNGGSGANTLGFYRTASASATPTTTNGIGIGLASFNFGLYNASAAADNDTNDAWYRITLSLTQGVTGYSGSISLLDGLGAPTGTAATFTGSLTSAMNWTGSTGDGIRISTGVGGTGTFDLDSIVVDATIPEPSSALLAGIGALGLLRRRR